MTLKVISSAYNTIPLFLCKPNYILNRSSAKSPRNVDSLPYEELRTEGNGYFDVLKNKRRYLGKQTSIPRSKKQRVMYGYTKDALLAEGISWM